jgi:putative heme-binding domain-containing protein
MAGQRTRLLPFEPLLLGGDAKRGRDMFFGKRATCSVCHRIAGQGGLVGPDLTKVGAIRSGRDLLESLILPSATIAQGYNPFLVTTTDGRSTTGVITRQTSDVLFVRDSEIDKMLGKQKSWSEVMFEINDDLLSDEEKIRQETIKRMSAVSDAYGEGTATAEAASAANLQIAEREARDLAKLHFTQGMERVTNERDTQQMIRDMEAETAEFSKQLFMDRAEIAFQFANIASDAMANATHTSSGFSSGRYGSHDGSPELLRLITRIHTPNATASGTEAYKR